MKKKSPRKSDTTEPPEPVRTVVGIGASAGGLTALKALFAAVPAKTGLAWVVVVHLSPEHESHLAELLQPHVGMPVQQITETTGLEADRMYVIPPGANLSAVDTHLRLDDLEAKRGQRAPIDHFFRTLSKTHDGHSVGVILTGTGSDGTLGLREIKEQGGLTIVQDPSEAEYDGMPQSAISTGMVDHVLPLAEIPAAILGFARTEPKVRLPDPDDDIGPDQARLLQKVFAQIRARTGRDFARYKRSTILRRVARRMQMRRMEEMPAYLTLLREHPEEVRALADDLLITVTSFFRDPDVYHALKVRIIPQLMREHGPEDVLRVWSVGCSTGEEAYTLAMLLMEEAARHDEPPRIQLFASDLHETSLERARQGFYPGDIATDVSPERLRRFFTEEDGGYRIRRELRDLVVFSPHNLLGDPPFSRIDLISCRNVMIYLDRHVQSDVVGLFHYALRPRGFLVLGTSETVETKELFEVADKKLCIWRRRDVPPPQPRLPVFPLPHQPRPPSRPQAPEEGEPLAHGEVHQRMIERYGPPSLLVTPDDRVVHLSHTAGRYLVHPGGELTSNVYRLVREALRIELRSALHEARRTGVPLRTRAREVRFDGDSADVVMDVRPVPEPGRQGFALVLFSEHPPGSVGQAEVGEDGDAARGASELGDAQGLRAELGQSQERLQVIIEEYEASQEELKASNEELQSSNEELRSTMEELETSKEELQSMNEELQTVNQENRHKVAELSQLSGYLQNLLGAADIATLFLDREQRIMRYTPRVADLFKVRPVDQGRPVSDLTHVLDYDELEEDARRVLDKLIPVVREVRDHEGHWYLTRVLPYRSQDDRIEGVVITFVDITDRKKAEEALRDAREYAESIVETLHEPLLVLDSDLRIRDVNPAFFAHFQVREEETVGQLIYDLGNGQWNIPELRTLLEDVLPESDVFNDYEVRHVFDDLGERVMLLNARRLDHVQFILLGIRDITDQKRHEEALRESRERLAAFLEQLPVGAGMLDAEGEWVLKNPVMERFAPGRIPSKDESQQHRWMCLDGEGRTVPPSDWPGLRALRGESVRPGMLFRHASEEGQDRWIQVSATPVMGPGGEVEGAIVVAENVTERQEAERLLEGRVEQRTREVRELSEILSVAEQEERQRLSHLLHDDLQQLLYGVQMKTTLARDEAERENLGAVQEHLDRGLALLKDAILRTRQLTVDLNPPILDGEGLVGAIGWLRGHMRDLHGIEVEFHAETEVRIHAADLRILLFQITRELLFNAAKHANTEHVNVTVEEVNGGVRVTVADRGVGFDPEAVVKSRPARGGLGLLSARERLRMRGGELEIFSVPGEGTRIVAHAPLDLES